MTGAEWWWLAAVIVAAVATLLRLVAALRPVAASTTTRPVLDLGHLAGALAVAAVGLVAAGLLALP